MNSIRIDLSTEPLWTSTGTETRGEIHVARCDALDLEVRCKLNAMNKLCRQIAETLDASALLWPVSVFRGSTPAFKEMPLKSWVEQRVIEGTNESARFARFENNLKRGVT